MREEIFYVPDTYAEKVVQQYTGAQRNQLIEELKKTLRILKFYTNNDFAFKECTMKNCSIRMARSSWKSSSCFRGIASSARPTSKRSATCSSSS